MKITAHTIDGCFYCNQLKELLRRADLPAEFILVEDKEEFVSKYPNAKGYPWVIIDDEEVGGLVEVATFLVKKGLVSSKK
jgi:glutaredoxin